MIDAVLPGHGHGDVFLDARGEDRALRLTWHPEADVVVLSLWRGETCAGTFRLPQADVAAFIDALVDGLRDTPGSRAPALPPFTDWALRLDGRSAS